MDAKQIAEEILQEVTKNQIRREFVRFGRMMTGRNIFEDLSVPEFLERQAVREVKALFDKEMESTHPYGLSYAAAEVIDRISDVARSVIDRNEKRILRQLARDLANSTITIIQLQARLYVPKWAPCFESDHRSDLAPSSGRKATRSVALVQPSG
jgi:hypothetical protein